MAPIAWRAQMRSCHFAPRKNFKKICGGYLPAGVYGLQVLPVGQNVLVQPARLGIFVTGGRCSVAAHGAVAPEVLRALTPTAAGILPMQTVPPYSRAGMSSVWGQAKRTVAIDTLVKWIWDPALCLVYLSLGVVFVYLTRGIAWRKSPSVFLDIFRDYKSTSGKRDTSFRKAIHLYLARRAVALADKKTPPPFLEISRDGSSIPSDRIISHKKAFLTVVATTVGIGNIAGVGTAIHLGGPGALFWMWVSALFGMFFRMASTYMAIKLRPADGKSLSFATPMVYLEKYATGKWKFITPLVTGLILIQGVVLYNLVQVNSVAHAVHNRFGVPNLVVAVLMTVSVGVVILGGLNKIVNYCSTLPPVAIGIYVVTGLAVLACHPVQAINALGLVFSSAFTPYSIAGGVAGYTVLQAMQFGVSRGVFSHMSGMGTGAFLQAANEETPAEGAFMSAMTPFVDTIIICSITGLVILSGPNWKYQTGAYLTAESFEAGIGFLGQLVVVASLIIFALTTILAFAHIAERCFTYLGGTNFFYYRIFFLVVVFLAPFLNLRFVWSLSDLIIAMIIIFHLIPLLFITLKNRDVMNKDLQDLKFEAGRQEY